MVAHYETPDSIRLGFLKRELEYKDDEQLAIIKSKKVEDARLELTKCYEDIISLLGEWVDIPESSKKLIATWIIGTYFHKSFSTFPYLFFNAVRGSGKTRLLSLISWLQFNGNGSVLNNPSEPVLFRTASERGLIFDEFESEKSKEKQTMREYLNSCYKKGGEVFRMEKEKDKDGKERLVPKGYKLFTPVAMANINGIEDVLADRSITLILEKSSNFALVKKIEDFDYNPKIKDLKVRLSKFSVELCSVELLLECIGGWNVYVSDKYTSLHTIHMYTSTLHQEELEIYNKIDGTGIFGRNLELFFPLLVTARLLNSFVFDDLLKIAGDLNSVKKDDEFAESKDVTLIEFVSNAERYRFEYTFVNDLLREFKEYVGSIGEEEDRWITSNWLGIALKRLKLLADRKRIAKGIMVLLNVDKAKERLKMFKTDRGNEDG